MALEDTFELVRRRAFDPKTRTDQMDVIASTIRPVLGTDVLDQAAELIGVVLPELLRRMYSEIGDGGFGPGYGFMPLGLGSRSGDESITALFRDFSSPDPQDPSWSWPKGLLPIVHMGCAIYPCVRLSDLRIIVFDPNAHDSDWAEAFLDQKCTFEEWIRTWANGEDLWSQIYNDRVA
jgi:hypothetical protein